MTNNNGVPADLAELLPWLNIIRRMRSASFSSGYAVLGIRVIVDDSGTPIQWTAPTVTLLEPRREGGAIDILLTTLNE